MDKVEAKGILEAFLEELQRQSFEELRGLISNPQVVEKHGSSGACYQIEYEAVWDFAIGGNLRIIASIDDGGLLSALIPITSGFLVSPQGNLIN